MTTFFQRLPGNFLGKVNGATLALWELHTPGNQTVQLTIGELIQAWEEIQDLLCWPCQLMDGCAW